jgi:hypothetical protein
MSSREDGIRFEPDVLTVAGERIAPIAAAIV